MQWVQEPSQSNANNLKNVRREAATHFRNKKKGYLQFEINELETYSKFKDIRDLYGGISDFVIGYSLEII